MTQKTVQRCKNIEEMIFYQAQLVIKGKQATNLLTLLQDYELDSDVAEIPPRIFNLHVIAYILQQDYFGLKLLLERQQDAGDFKLKPIIELCTKSLEQDLQQFQKIASNFIQSQEISYQNILSIAVVKYILNTLAKYYSNIEVKSFLNLCPVNETKLKDICVSCGHKIKDGYIILSKKEQCIKDTQKVMLHKLKEIVQVASIMAKLQ